MKPIVKYALAGLALAASSAYADVELPSSDNGELVLFVRDLSDTSRVFAVGLSINLDNVLSQTAITNTPGSQASLQNGQPISLNYALPEFSSSALATFMSQPSALGYDYAIMGGDSVGTNNFSDARRYVSTSSLQYTSTVLSAVTNNNLNDATGVGADMELFMGELNELLPDSEGSSIANANYGAEGTSGGGAPTWWSKLAPSNNTAVGTATNLYVFTSGGGTSGAKARVYQGFDVVLNADGTLQAVGAPQVPLPAAVWLLGSALIGFTTITRRRAGASA
jgi:hypothetical protein